MKQGTLLWSSVVNCSHFAIASDGSALNKSLIATLLQKTFGVLEALQLVKVLLNMHWHCLVTVLNVLVSKQLLSDAQAATIIETVNVVASMVCLSILHSFVIKYEKQF